MMKIFRFEIELTRTSRDASWHVFEHRKDKYMFGAQVCQLTAGFETELDTFGVDSAADSLFTI